MILVLTSEYSSSSVKKVMTVSEAIIDIGESHFGLELDKYQTFVINNRDAKDDDERIAPFEKANNYIEESGNRRVPAAGFKNLGEKEELSLEKLNVKGKL